MSLSRRRTHRCVLIAVMLLSAASCLVRSEPQGAQVRRTPSPHRQQAPVASAQTATHESSQGDGTPVRRLSDQTIRVCLLDGRSEIALRSEGEINLTHETGPSGPAVRRLSAGMWTFRLVTHRPARQVFHLFLRSFRPGEQAEAAAYLTEWRKQGYSPESVTLGQCYRTESGELLDERICWVSLARCSTREEAAALQTALKAQNINGWVRAETVEAGVGVVAVRQDDRAELCQVSAPLELFSNHPISIAAGQPHADQAFVGILDIAVNHEGLLRLCETLPLEDYLTGVLPSEMPASWPMEALKAQAVAARSEALANIGIKHGLEGFHYCSAQHCRVYAGHSGRHPAADEAVMATRSEVLVYEDRIPPAAFSANCGGWTEDNDTVWWGPPQPCLRGVADSPLLSDPAPGSLTASGLRNWLLRSPAAYCSADTRHFRWRKRFTASELSAAVNKRHAVGAVREIVLGDRGVSGRLKWVKIVGASGAAVVQKELAIRQTLGGLPSALFIVDTTWEPDGRPVFTFIGGGRGHGVGLCQQGARGMAAKGGRHTEILAHYFSGAVVERLQ